MHPIAYIIIVSCGCQGDQLVRSSNELMISNISDNCYAATCDILLRLVSWHKR